MALGSILGWIFCVYTLIRFHLCRMASMAAASNFPSRGDIVKAGYLTAKHSLSLTWRKRWYVLRDSSLLDARRKKLGYARLEYYKSESEVIMSSSATAVGINLQACIELQPRGAPVANHSLVFDITTDTKRTYRFSAASLREKQEWVDCLRNYIAPSNPEFTPKPRPVSAYAAIVQSVKLKLPKKSYSTKLSQSTSSAVSIKPNSGGLHNTKRRGSEALDLEMGTLKTPASDTDGTSKTLDYLDVDVSHALATATTVRTPCSDDRVIYSETNFTPDSKQGNLELEGAGFDQKGKPGLLEPAHDDITLSGQIKHCKILEISSEHITYTDATETRGVWRQCAVALKRGQSARETLQEAVTLGQLCHPNIVRLFGITLPERPCLVVELLDKGDLKSHLQSLRSKVEESAYENAQFELAKSLSEQLLQFSENIALALSYLASLGFVHNKLTAKAVMVSDKNICKIADFDVHGKQAPVKWCAPEASVLYSTASDVWSLAVVMFEIWSLGLDPYEQFTDKEVVELVNGGYRLPPPPGMAVELYNLMILCWNPEPSSRPSSASVLSSLSAAEASVKVSALYSVEGTVLGGALESSEHLHKGLQQMYLKKTHQVKKVKEHSGIELANSQNVPNATEQYELSPKLIIAKLKASEKAQCNRTHAVKLEHSDSCPDELLGHNAAQNGEGKGRYESVHTGADRQAEIIRQITDRRDHYESVQTYEHTGPEREEREQREGSHYERIQHCDLSPQRLASFQDSEERRHCKQPLTQHDKPPELTSVH